MREMILADNLQGRTAALAKLLPFQREDFLGLFREMRGLPVTIRLLDPPLHEFLPMRTKADRAGRGHELSGLPVRQVEQRVKELHEYNPMLGHRGCRLAITFPEVYAMQVRADFRGRREGRREGIEVRSRRS